MSSTDSEHPYRQVPTVQAKEWQNFAVFRETFLADFDDAEDNRAMRALAKMLYAGMLESFGPLPASPEHEIADQLRAVLADLRHLQGYLGATVLGAEMKREDHEVDEDQAERHEDLCDLGVDLQEKIGALADRLEQELEVLKPS